MSAGSAAGCSARLTEVMRSPALGLDDYRCAGLHHAVELVHVAVNQRDCVVNRRARRVHDFAFKQSVFEKRPHEIRSGI